LQWIIDALELKLLMVLCKTASLTHELLGQENLADGYAEVAEKILRQGSNILQNILFAMESGSTPLYHVVKKSIRTVESYGVDKFIPTHPDEPQVFWSTWKNFYKGASALISCRERFQTFMTSRCHNLPVCVSLSLHVC
jgi:hypothetical protein